MTARGHTLVELLVVLAMLGVVAGIALLAFRPGSEAQPSDDPVVAKARQRALASGRPVTVSFARAGNAAVVTVLPDGRVVGDSASHLDPFTGRSRAAR
jgi:prepilin-type N-terminal cleavage/methylation domain-containing protein